MFMRVVRIFAIAVVALQLGACILSNYDIANDLKPEFPIKPGTYVSGKGTTYVVRRSGDHYRITSPQEKETNYGRLFKIPEYPDYVFQFYDDKKKPYYYLFLKQTDKGFDIYDVGKLATVLPEHLAKLVAPITDDDRKYNTITIANPKRDTLYLIRELSRANLPMIVPENNGYERRP